MSAALELVAAVGPAVELRLAPVLGTESASWLAQQIAEIVRRGGTPAELAEAVADATVRVLPVVDRLPPAHRAQTALDLATGRPGEVLPVHRLAAQQTRPDGATDPDVQMVALALADELRRLRRAVGMDGDAPPPEHELPDAPGLLAADEQAARWLERAELAPAGAEIAESVRQASRCRWEHRGAAGADLWALWLPADPGGPPWVALAVAEALWARVAEEQRRPPALSLAVEDHMIRLHRRGLTVARDGRALVRPGEQPIELRVPDRAPRVPVVDAALLAAGVGRLGSLTAQRLIRWEVATGYRQSVAEIPDPRLIDLPGGWTELADRIGEPSRKAITAVREIVMVQACAVWRLGRSAGNLIALEEWGAGRGRRVRIVLGTMLLPRYVLELASRRSRRSPTYADACRLVPLPERLPPLVGRERDHGPQAALHLAVMAELRRRARQLARQGSVRIAQDRWLELAEMVGLPDSLLHRVLDAWLAGDDQAPAVLTRPDQRYRWRFALAPAYRAASDYMAAAGRKETSSAAGGRIAAERR